ncbi:hypothetical protein F5Y13DRAFT_198874 [Hypoxylon sp. FL1857]|nr:hypothetical protein F5Y13DRAFT_198874 [Hypoxylon sp. FL1857]
MASTPETPDQASVDRALDDKTSPFDIVKSDEAMKVARSILYGKEKKTIDFSRSFQENFRIVIGMNQGKLKEMGFFKEAMTSFVGLIMELLDVMSMPGRFDHLEGKNAIRTQLLALKIEFDYLEEISPKCEGRFKENFFDLILTMRKYLFFLRATLQKKLDKDSVILGDRLWNGSNIAKRLATCVGQMRKAVTDEE